jgi:hypothetical protein
MKRDMGKKGISVLLALCLVAACKSPESKTAVGAGIGCGVGGYALCRLLKKEHDECIKIAAVAAVACAAIGYTYSKKLEKRRQELAGKENDLDARLKFVRGVNQDTEAFNQQLADKVKNTQQLVDAAQSKTEAGKLSQEEQEKSRATLDQDIKAASDQVAMATRELEDLKRFRSTQTQQSAALDAEITRLDQLLAQAQRNTSALASLRQRL